MFNRSYSLCLGSLRTFLWMHRGGRAVTVLLLGNGTAPTDRDNASQSLVNDSATEQPLLSQYQVQRCKGSPAGPAVHGTLHPGLSRQISSTAQLLVVALQLAQYMSKAGWQVRANNPALTQVTWDISQGHGVPVPATIWYSPTKGNTWCKWSSEREDSLS